MLVKKQEKGNTLGAGEKRGKSECTIEKSSLVPMLKIKPDVQSCGNYRRIKLMSHTMKMWERGVEVRLSEEVMICRYGFMLRKSTTDTVFHLRMLIEKYREVQKDQHCVFVERERESL